MDPPLDGYYDPRLKRAPDISLPQETHPYHTGFYPPPMTQSMYSYPASTYQSMPTMVDAGVISAQPSTPHQRLPPSVTHQQSLLSTPENEGAFPLLGSVKPSNKAPTNAPRKRHQSDHDQGDSPQGLEESMRNMILRNQPKNSSQSPQIPLQDMQQPQLSATPRSGRKDKQRMRKQQYVNGQHLVTNQASPIGNQTNTDYGRGANVQNPLPPANSFPQIRSSQDVVLPHRRGEWRQSQAPPGHMQISRPPPTHKTLFDPRSQPSWQRNQPDSLGSDPQLHYLGPIVQSSVERSQISQDELVLKQELRFKLQELCKAVVAEHEKAKNPKFTAESIALESFGSLATTFATNNSDMDLVLVSPFSAIDASSIDSPLPRIIEKALLTSCYGARLLTRTRVPIIKFCELPTLELLDRLTKARDNWEQGRSHPDSPSLSASSNGGLGPTLPQNMPNTWDIETGLGRAMINNDEHDPDGPPKSPIGHSTSSREVLSAESATPNAVFSSQPNDLSPTKSALGVEADDPKIDSKPDEERARLYRLAIKEEWYSPTERILIFDFFRALDKLSRMCSIDATTNLNNARSRLGTLPNVLKRYRSPTAKYLDFPKSGVGIQCDINFSNHLAIHNSALLRCYSKCDPRVRPIVIFIKSWAKQRRINSAYEGSLSSYGYVLMILHYLIQIACPPVLPNLQHFGLSSDPASISGPQTIDGHTVHFFRDEAFISKQADAGNVTTNKESIPSLIRGFFAYYGGNIAPTFQWTITCIAIRTPAGTVSKGSKGWVAAKTEHRDAGGNEKKEIRQRYLVAIEDPFETEHNVGRTVSHDGICAIRDEFRRAHRLISTVGGRGEELMAEAPERGNLQFRYFGPNFLKMRERERERKARAGGAGEDKGTSNGRKQGSKVENADGKIDPAKTQAKTTTMGGGGNDSTMKQRQLHPLNSSKAKSSTQASITQPSHSAPRM